MKEVFCILQTIPDQGSMAITLYFRNRLSYRNKISFLGAYNKKAKMQKIWSSQTHTGLLSLRRILTPSLLSFILYPKLWFHYKNNLPYGRRWGQWYILSLIVVIVLVLVWIILKCSLSNVSTPRNSELLNCCRWIGLISQNYLQALHLYQHSLDKYSERW